MNVALTRIRNLRREFMREAVIRPYYIESSPVMITTPWGALSADCRPCSDATEITATPNTKETAAWTR